MPDRHSLWHLFIQLKAVCHKLCRPAGLRKLRVCHALCIAFRLAITAVPVSVSRGYLGQPANQPLSHWPQPPTASVNAGLRATTSTVQPHRPTAQTKAVRTASRARSSPFPWQAGGGARVGPQRQCIVATLLHVERDVLRLYF